ncbi:cupin domain-containing protein [Steroidobacter cummioxidans]|uniref:cupin domain-containing protein n=1 Tax=Steroidobacter cummioxidans TaxID=1803913 RepID=UPI0019D43971|nr:cupin domain-containing protein [Steroidobacter cummioxidans]
MDPAKKLPRTATIVAPGQGRVYPMGRMRAIFKADGDETETKYSISEWWLEPNTTGPGAHEHPEDHVYYVIDGELSVCFDGAWSQAERGSYILIPGGTSHDFQNRSSARVGFMSINVPGGFESHLPSIVEWFAEHPPGDANP